jgi:hypothetical protein
MDRTRSAGEVRETPMERRRHPLPSACATAHSTRDLAGSPRSTRHQFTRTTAPGYSPLQIRVRAHFARIHHDTPTPVHPDEVPPYIIRIPPSLRHRFRTLPLERISPVSFGAPGFVRRGRWRALHTRRRPPVALLPGIAQKKVCHAEAFNTARYKGADRHVRIPQKQACLTSTPAASIPGPPRAEGSPPPRPIP